MIRERRQFLVILVCTAVIGAVPSTARAQQSVRQVLSFLLTNQAVRTGDIEKDAEATAATRDTISNALLVELATLPISTSSGGFTYVFNSELGTRERASSSFGPFFVERALTSGRNQMSFGATFRYSEFDQLDGNDLRSGNFVTTATQFRDEPQPFDVETVTLRLKTQTVTGFANYGVTDRIDIGVAVPIVSMELSGERINTYRGQTIPQAAATATTSGVADMAISARAHLLGGRASGLTAGVQARLPTGREEDLLGTGEAAVRVLAIGSVEGSRIGAHVNSGYTWGGISREANYSAAMTVTASDRFTLVGEFLGRWVEGLGQYRPGDSASPEQHRRGHDTPAANDVGHHDGHGGRGLQVERRRSMAFQRERVGAVDRPWTACACRTCYCAGLFVRRLASAWRSTASLARSRSSTPRPPCAGGTSTDAARLLIPGRRPLECRLRLPRH